MTRENCENRYIYDTFGRKKLKEEPKEYVIIDTYEDVHVREETVCEIWTLPPWSVRESRSYPCTVRVYEEKDRVPRRKYLGEEL